MGQKIIHVCSSAQQTSNEKTEQNRTRNAGSLSRPSNKGVEGAQDGNML